MSCAASSPMYEPAPDPSSSATAVRGSFAASTSEPRIAERAADASVAMDGARSASLPPADRVPPTGKTAEPAPRKNACPYRSRSDRGADPSSRWPTPMACHLSRSHAAIGELSPISTPRRSPASLPTAWDSSNGVATMSMMPSFNASMERRNRPRGSAWTGAPVASCC